MKKKFVAAICIFTTLSLTACGAAVTVSPSEPSSSAAPIPATPAPTESIPDPVLKVVDENGADLGTAIDISVGSDNGIFLRFLTENLGELNPRVGWDDAALTEAGFSVEPRFEPEFGIYLSAEKAATADLRLFLSATENWSDAEAPPVEWIVTVNAK